MAQGCGLIEGERTRRGGVDIVSLLESTLQSQITLLTSFLSYFQVTESRSIARLECSDAIRLLQLPFSGFKQFLPQPPEVSLCHPGWRAVVQSWLTATSASRVQRSLALRQLECVADPGSLHFRFSVSSILLPQPPEYWDSGTPTRPANFLSLVETGFHRRQSLTQPPKLECNGTIMAHCSFKLLGSSILPTQPPE
ncbi:hypothetical protein AAY473_001732 [Plecturocebus cupreus]